MKRRPWTLALSALLLLSGAALAAEMGEGGMGMMDMPMMKEHMSRMRDHMKAMKSAKTDAERTRLMQEHMDMMDDHMDMMMKMMDGMGAQPTSGAAGSKPKPVEAPAADDADHEAHHPKKK